MASLTVDDLELTYPGGHRALDGVSLAAADGEFLALVGPSGSGKTTLLRTVAGFLTPQRGSVRIGEHAVADAATYVPTERRRLGMVFQTHAIWPHWDVGRNVGYPLRLARVPRAEMARRVDEALRLVGLPDAQCRDPATLSGGQRQRVALARALVTSPDVLLLDEALASLDEPLRATLRLELKEMTARAGQTVVHVTHDRAEALALADRVVVMRDGRIEQVGAPQEIVDRPATAFVAHFLGDATTADGTLADGLFRAADSTAIAVPAVRRVGDGAAGTLAVLPGDLSLDGAADPAAPTAQVTAVLYRPDGHDVTVGWQGRQWRARLTGGAAPRVGETVRPAVRRAFFFAG